MREMSGHGENEIPDALRKLIYIYLNLKFLKFEPDNNFTAYEINHGWYQQNLITSTKIFIFNTRQKFKIIIISLK